MFRVTLSLLLFALLPLTANALADSCRSTLYDLTTPAGYSHGKYAPVEIERLYDGKSFVASIDGPDDDDGSFGGDYYGDFLVQPQWVSTHIKKYEANNTSGFASGYERPNRWYEPDIFNEDKAEAKSSNTIAESYQGENRTWNRGQYATRADANRIGKEYGCNTHVFANAFPQSAKLNQGIWLGFEYFVSGLANQIGELWVITGPVFSSPLKTIGDETEVPIAIPDMVFKIVVWETPNGLETAAVLYPNRPDSPGYKSGRCFQDKSYDHSPYFVSILEIEEATGLSFDHLGDIYSRQQRTSQLPYVKKEFRVGSRSCTVEY